MFERFTERARQVVVFAQDEARNLQHSYIGTEHILLGLLREEEGIGSRVLVALNVSVDEVRSEVTRIVGLGDDVTTGQIPFTPRAKKVLELALREALNIGHNYIGTEHILLGLVSDNQGVAYRILEEMDVSSGHVKSEILRLLQGPGKKKPEPILGIIEKPSEMDYVDIVVSTGDVLVPRSKVHALITTATLEDEWFSEFIVRVLKHGYRDELEKVAAHELYRRSQEEES